MTFYLLSFSFPSSLIGFFSRSFRHSLNAGPLVTLSPSLPPLHSSAFPSIRDVIASHRAAIFSSPSLRVNLPIEITVGRGTEWSANRRRMMILLSSLATALFCGPRTSLAVIKLFTRSARLSFEPRDEIALSHTIPWCTSQRDELSKLKRKSGSWKYLRWKLNCAIVAEFSPRRKVFFTGTKRRFEKLKSRQLHIAECTRPRDK